MYHSKTYLKYELSYEKYYYEKNKWTLVDQQFSSAIDAHRIASFLSHKPGYRNIMIVGIVSDTPAEIVNRLGTIIFMTFMNMNRVT
jgi:hypothetical protein